LLGAVSKPFLRLPLESTVPATLPLLIPVSCLPANGGMVDMRGITNFKIVLLAIVAVGCIATVRRKTK